MSNNKKTILHIEIDGHKINIERSRYAKAKFNDLRAFGYTNLTLAEVESEIDNVINGNELSVIGMFMQDEIKDRVIKHSWRFKIS